MRCALPLHTLLPVLAVLLATLTADLRPVLAADNGALILGIFPRRNFQDTLKDFDPLAEYLTRKIGRQVRIDTAKDFDAFWLGVLDRRYDIVHYNQYHYLRSHRDLGYEVILMNEELGRATIAGAVSVRADSGYKALADLKGKQIIFGGDRSAMQSYIVATYLLRMAGLKNGDYAEKFAKNPPNAHLAVYYGQADAAGVGDGVNELPIVRNKIDVTKMKMLAVGQPLAHLPWAVRGDMDPALREQIAQALLDLKNTPEGRNILKQAKLTGLRAATNANYESSRKIVEAVFGEAFSPEPANR